MTSSSHLRVAEGTVLRSRLDPGSGEFRLLVRERVELLLDRSAQPPT